MSSKPQRQKPEVGQAVHVRPISFRRDKKNPKKLYPGTITKISRKYFTVRCNDIGQNLEFTIDRWDMRGGDPSYALYASPQELEDEFEFIALAKKIREIFGGYGSRTKWGSEESLSLQALRGIDSIIQADLGLNSGDDSDNGNGGD